MKLFSHSITHSRPAQICARLGSPAFSATPLRQLFSAAVGLCLLGGSPSVLSQDVGIALTKGALTESYSEKLVRIPGEPVEPGEPKNPPTYEIAATKKLTASTSGKFSHIETGAPATVAITAFNGDTPVSFSLGGYSFSGKLSGDPKYVAGKSKKAVFPFTIPDPKDDNGVKELKIGTITFTWAAKTASVALTTKSLDDSAAIYDFLGLGETPGKAVKFASGAFVEFAIGELYGSRPILFKGQSKFTEKKVGNGDEAEIYQLQSASLAGTVDTKAPILKSKVPLAADDSYWNLRLVYSENDSFGLSDFKVSVNGRTGNEAFDEINVRLPDDDGNFPVEITGLYLDPGENTVIFTATDLSGNVSTVKKTITAPKF